MGPELGSVKATIRNTDGEIVYEGEAESVVAYLKDTTVEDFIKDIESRNEELETGGKLNGDKKC